MVEEMLEGMKVMNVIGNDSIADSDASDVG